MFSYNLLLERHWQLRVHCTHTCRYEAICPFGRCNPFEQLVEAKGLSFNQRAFLCKVFWFFFFLQSWKALFTTPLVLTLPRHYVQALHITRYKYLCQWFHSFCRLDAGRLPMCVKMGAQFFGVRCWISHPEFSVFHDYCQRRLKKYSAFVTVWEIFCFDTARYRIKQLNS